jgi:hypothetical protein
MRIAQAIPLSARVRADALPEYTRYRDDGCEVNASCLTCPLPRCRYEEPGGLRALLNEYRDRQIVQLKMQGLGVDDLAVRFGISRRTVFRVLGSNGATTKPPGGGPRSSDGRGAPTPIRSEQRREAQCA